MSSHPIYFDYSATTPVDPRVVEKMLPWLYEQFGNPASNSHSYGLDAHAAVERARAQVAQLVNADPRDIVWTSGATESNNLAIKGVAGVNSDRSGHIVTVKTEHKAVLDTCRELERQGFQLTYLDVGPDGMLDLDVFKAALRPNTILASVMLVNNEIGVIQDIDAIGQACRERGIVFHVDAAQATGKMDIDLQTAPVDLMSFSAHKTYGPKGVGALYVCRKPRVRLQAQMHGGGHERGMRSGTLATHQLVGMGEAFYLAGLEMADEVARIRQLRDRLWAGVGTIDGILLNGHADNRVAHNLNLSVDYVEGEALLMGLRKLAVSSGSACTSASREPSYVLRALGRSNELAHSSIRFSLGRYTTRQDVDFAIGELAHTVKRLHDMSPLWEMAQQGINLDTMQWAV